MMKKVFFIFNKLKQMHWMFLVFVAFLAPEICANSNLTITDIRVGTEIDKTRVSFEMSYPVSLYIEDRGDGVFLVSGPEDTYWRVPPQKTVEKGPLKSYEIVNLDRGKGCLLRFNPYTRLVGSFGRENNYFLDLETKEPPPPPPPPAPVVAEEEPLNLPEPQPVAPTVTLNQEMVVKSNEINSIAVLPKQDGSTWIIINSDKEEFFEYQLVDFTREFHVYLPKINWPTLKTEVLNSGIVRSYSVDESSDKMSAIRMQLRPEEAVDVIDLFSASNLDGTFDFVIILASRRATPTEVQRIVERRIYMKKNMRPSSESFEFKLPIAYYGEKKEEGMPPPKSIPFPEMNSPMPAPQDRPLEEPLFDPVS